jgi:arginine deiminase
MELRREKMLRNEGESLKRVVVCTPKREYARAGNFEKHNIGELGNPKIAIQQHGTLKSKLSEFGAEVIDILEAERYIVHNLDLGEFAKGMGGPNCLIMPIERGD